MLGKEFVLEVDHRPLVFLNKFKGCNDRVMRWAISLQPYRFRIVYIPGRDNIGADLLSSDVGENYWFNFVIQVEPQRRIRFVPNDFSFLCK